MTNAPAPWLVGLTLALSLAGCTTQSVRTTEPEPVAQALAPIPEALLLDVGIGIFDPGTDGLSVDQTRVSAAVRAAESRYVPARLMETLQGSGNWGAVRMVPDRQSEMDVWVDGTIVHSDGETLELEVRVEDSTGRHWFTRTYEETVSRYAYEGELARRQEPFQNIYNRIANDLLNHRRGLDEDEIRTVRKVTELRFAQRLAPEAFGDHLVTGADGRKRIKRLPADNDPIMARVRRIRERDYLFVDTLQEHYNGFARQMDQPYRDWRQQSYAEAMALRETENDATNRMIGGALAVIGGILAQTSSSRGTRTAGAVSIGAGALVFKSGLDKREEAKMHEEALRELAQSLEAEVQPQTVALQDRTVTLTGTVQDQYDQWRSLLREMYLAETGELSTQDP